MSDWIFYAILIFFGVNIVWFVVVPKLRSGGPALPIDKLSAEARRDIAEQIELGNTRQAVALLRQEHPMSERRAEQTVAGWAAAGAASALPTAAMTAAAAAPTRPAADLASEITALLAVNQKIEAIKLYRDRTGSSLVDAKNAVESWRPGAEVPMPVPEPSMRTELPATVAAEIDRHVNAGNKIAAIKALREHAGLGLKEAKQAIDRWE